MQMPSFAQVEPRGEERVGQEVDVRIPEGVAGYNRAFLHAVIVVYGRCIASIVAASD